MFLGVSSIIFLVKPVNLPEGVLGGGGFREKGENQHKKFKIRTR